MIKPKVAVPMHVGKKIGSVDSADYFKQHAGVPVVVLPIEQ